MTPLSTRQLNRATLARQMLLERESVTPLRAIERLAGMQAQLARPPFIGLWSRLKDFRREQLTALIQRRAVVRGTLMRGTIHLVSAKDYVAMRGPVQPLLTEALRAALGKRDPDLDLPPLLAAAQKYLATKPCTFDELRKHLVARFPKSNDRAMGLAVRLLIPLVQVPEEDSAWGYPGSADFALAEDWLKRKIAMDAKPHALVLRYLAAFGPATPADAHTWSGLRGLAEIFAGLKSKLRTFTDERGRTLYDVPRSPQPPEDTPAPVRFLPEYDNLVMAHADRTRFIDEMHRAAIFRKNLVVPPMFMVDGFVRGTWKIERKGATATLVVAPFEALTKRVRAELEAEGEGLLRFVERDAGTAAVKIARTS